MTLQLTFVDYIAKDVLNINVESTILDAYEHKQGHLEMINTGFPDINWLTFLAQKKTDINLNKYNLHSVNKLNK